MSKWIKNDDTIAHTWVGQNVAAGAYYQIQSTEETAWAKESPLLVDIANGVALVAKDDSGNADITDVNDAINWLKDIPKDVLKFQETIGDDNLTDRPYGWQGAFTQTKNTNTKHQFKIEEANLRLRGGILYTDDAVVGDRIHVKIVDVDGVYYPAGTVLSDYCHFWPVNHKTGITEIKSESVSTDAIPINTYVELEYFSVGTVNDVKGAMGVYTYYE